MPTQEASLKLTILNFFNLSCKFIISTFSLERKGGAQSSRKIQMLRWIFLAYAQQQLLQHSSFTYLQGNSMCSQKYNFFKSS